MSNKKRKTSAEASEVVFEYTGIEEKSDIPRDVTIVRFHSSVIEVDDYMFRECRQLKEVILNEGLQKIGDSSFSYCSALGHIKLPSTVIEIGEGAFYNCGNLRKLVLNEGLQKIGNRSFHSCYKLEHINLSFTVTELGQSAFCGCHNLMTVILNVNNEALQTIGKYAFASCLSLESITIPPTVTDIRESTFFNCPRLREVELHERIQKISSTAFESCSSLERFTFPTLSARLDTISQAGKYENVENRIDGIRRSVERRSSELFVSEARVGPNWKRTRVILGRIDQFLTYYELKEATTLLELAIWKSKIDQAEVKHVNRDAHRIDIPGPVKDNILQFLNFRVIG